MNFNTDEPEDGDQFDAEGMPVLPIPPEKLDELARQVQDRARKLGLYAENIGVGTAISEDGDDDGPPQVALVGHFTIGRHAFRDRVQDPQADKAGDTLREMEVGYYTDKVDDIRREYEGGLGLLEPDDDSENDGA